ncbi:patatin-like phospholipase family protein [Chitinophaga sp. MM2321]|uniref:patatin-like phospholipase family protein n=1 Tax=Chitinophaga sp. MM2321 TaxID=3137178 RepID=UPI0032D59B6F
MNVLITSGGGAKGAFSVGALRHLMTTGGITAFDIISGTSTGALIAAMVAGNKIPDLVDIYLNNSNADVLNPQNAIDNLLNKKPYLYDTAPLENQIRQQIDAATYNNIMQSSTLLCLNTISLQTARLNIFSNKTVQPDQHYDTNIIDSRETMINALLGSTNQAVFMPPVMINGNQFVDGGNKEVIPTRVVISNLSGAADHQVYILSNNPDKQLQLTQTFTGLLDVLMRAITIFIQEVRENDLEVLRNYKKIAPVKIKVFYICPDKELDPVFPTGLRFDNLLMQAWMKQGQLKAKEILKKFPDGNL